MRSRRKSQSRKAQELLGKTVAAAPVSRQKRADGERACESGGVFTGSKREDIERSGIEETTKYWIY
jgi:hypothetical protein